jgi:hypothetical protein
MSESNTEYRLSRVRRRWVGTFSENTMEHAAAGSALSVWGIQLSSGYSWSAARVAAGKNDLGLTTLDLDAVGNITPQYPIAAYAIIGADYAWANLDTPTTETPSGIGWRF